MKSFSLTPLQDHKKLKELLGSIEFRSAYSVYSPDLLKKFEIEKDLLRKKNGKSPRCKKVFHITSEEKAQKIVQSGFNINLSRNKAFGKGANFCDRAEETMRYRKKAHPNALLVCQILIGKSHANRSDLNLIVINKDGSSYSKPLYMKPRGGYDSMYSGTQEKKIWIIPSSKRILPLYLVILK